MVEHELCHPRSPPFRPDENEGDIGLSVADVGQEEGETNHELAVQGNAAEVGMLKRLGNWKRDNLEPCFKRL